MWKLFFYFPNKVHVDFWNIQPTDPNLKTQYTIIKFKVLQILHYYTVKTFILKIINISEIIYDYCFLNYLVGLISTIKFIFFTIQYLFSKESRSIVYSSIFQNEFSNYGNESKTYSILYIYISVTSNVTPDKFCTKQCTWITISC